MRLQNNVILDALLLKLSTMESIILFKGKYTSIQSDMSKPPITTAILEWNWHSEIVNYISLKFSVFTKIIIIYFPYFYSMSFF